MKSLLLFWGLAFAIVVLALSNWSLYRAWQHSAALNQRMAAELREVPQEFQRRAQAWTRGIQAEAAQAFSEMLTHVELSNRLTQEGQENIQQLVTEREATIQKIQSEPQPSGKLRIAFEVMDLDRRIMDSFRDLNQLQAMHRQKIFETLQPLAEELGLAGQNTAA